MDVSVPDDMDGQVLEEILTAEFRARRPVVQRPAHPQKRVPAALSADEQAEVEARLRGLGYLG